MQGVPFAHTALERHELAARVLHEGEEQQAVLGVVPAAQDRDAARPWRGLADVGVLGQLRQVGRLEQAAAVQRDAAPLVAADDLLLLRM